MSQHIEIEFKNLLTEQEFFRLKESLAFTDVDFKKQINHYFDSADFSLKTEGCALRIREKGANFELTLKQPAAVGLLETNQVLSKTETETAVKSGILPNGPVNSAIARMFDDSIELAYFGSLTTFRAEKPYKNGLIVLDHSIYLNAEDFEVEYEVEDEKLGLQQFKNLLNEQNIPTRKTENKVMRFYKQKLKRMKENQD